MTLEEARRKLPLDLLMAHLGHHEAAKPRSNSPFRKDKTPSFGVYRADDGRLRWKDHATGEGGDEVDYLAQFYGCSPAEATRRYLELAGAPATQSQHPTGKYRVGKNKAKAGDSGSHSGRESGTAPTVFSWAEYRARVTPEFIGLMVEERALPASVFEWARDAGIFGATSDGHPAFIVNSGSACHYRVQDGSWRYEPRGAKTQALCFGKPDAPEAWVFESQWDALAVLSVLGAGQLDNTLFVVTRGANNGKLAAEPCDGKTVVAWPQNDSAKANGKIPSEEWLSDVRAATNKCRVVRVPGQHKDVNDWVEVGATEREVRHAVSSAQLPELLNVEIYKHKDLLDFVPADDPTVLIGNRWICRGGSALLVGPAGIGKSSLAAQFAVLWALGLPACGIAPKRPLKSVFVQAENDEGDMAEMVQGVYKLALDSSRKHGMTVEEVSTLLKANLVFARDTTHAGESFAAAADALAGLHKPDLFWCDPLLSYVGDDISSQRVASNFLRGMLNPISFRHGFAWMMVHHTGKPPTDAKARQKWTESDFSYIGLGSSELTNWARACLYLQQLEDGLFCLHLTKRGKRAGVATPSGFSITKIGLEHGEKAICWEDADLPQDGEKAGALTQLQIDDVIRLRAEGKSLSKIIVELDLKNSKGTAMSKGTLCKIMAKNDTEKGGKKA